MVRITRSLISLLLAASMIVALCVVPALAENIPVWINNSSATIYTASGETGSLSAGTGVYMTAYKNGWAQIEYKGNVGYIRRKYLTLVNGYTGYVTKSVPVYKSASSSSAQYGPLDVGTELKVVGIDGNFYQVTNGKAYAYIQKSAISPNKPSDTTILASKVELVNWSAGNKLMKVGGYVQIYDIKTGIIFRAYRRGGSNHAELEPATSEDTEKLLKISGGQFSWASRAVIVYTGSTYIAGAINTMPHGDQTIRNNDFNGQFCLHLPGSKTHETNVENPSHQAAIKYAYAWATSKR